MKISKTILAVLTIGLLTCGLFSQQVQATPINGNITFFGTVSLDTGNVNNAHSVTAWHGLGGAGLPFVASADGDFTGLTGMTATYHAPWSFNSGPISTFWTVGGFTFDLLVSSITLQGGGSIVVDGTGTINAPGFDPTAGVWHFTTQGPKAQGVFSFSAATGAVPDGGSAVALLGLALTGIEVLRRRLRIC
jgi:VPDSG-CTERM motif